MESQVPWIIGLVVGAVVLIFYRQVAALYSLLFAWVPFKSPESRERYFRVTAVVVGTFFVVLSTAALLTGASPVR